MPKFRALLILLCALSTAALVHADDHITVAEVLPILRGSEAGNVDLGPAPAPGAVRTLRAREVRDALTRAGHSVDGLNIPTVMRVQRGTQALDQNALQNLVRPELDRAFFPCTVTEAQLPARVTLGEGDVSVEATGTAPRASGHATASVSVAAGGVTTRISVTANVECPAPVVAAGSHVQIVAIVGHVRATAPGTAMQPGRVGDEIRVTSNISRANLRARVVDASTVEVLR